MIRKALHEPLMADKSGLQFNRQRRGHARFLSASGLAPAEGEEINEAAALRALLRAQEGRGVNLETTSSARTSFRAASAAKLLLMRVGAAALSHRRASRLHPRLAAVPHRGDNIGNVARQSVYLVLVSLGQMIVLLTGGFRPRSRNDDRSHFGHLGNDHALGHEDRSRFRRAHHRRRLPRWHGGCASHRPHQRNRGRGVRSFPLHHDARRSVGGGRGRPLSHRRRARDRLSACIRRHIRFRPHFRRAGHRRHRRFRDRGHRHFSLRDPIYATTRSAAM